MDFQYYQSVRETIGSLDRLVINLLVQGTAFTLAVLGIGGGVQDILGPALTFFLHIPLFILTVFLWFGLYLYSGLLRKAVRVGKAVEHELLQDERHQLHLTCVMDESKLAAGRWGRYFYLACATVLVAVTGVVSGVHGYAWIAKG